MIISKRDPRLGNSMFRHFLFKESIRTLPEDIQRYMEPFLFYQVSTVAFAKMRLQRGWDAIHNVICHAQSRANGFYDQEEKDTCHPHWIFSVLEEDTGFSLQAISCLCCGGYIVSNNTRIPIKATCFCMDP